MRSFILAGFFAFTGLVSSTPVFAADNRPQAHIDAYNTYKPAIDSFGLQMLFRQADTEDGLFSYAPDKAAELSNQYRLKIFEKLRQLPPSEDIVDALELYVSMYIQRIDFATVTSQASSDLVLMSVSYLGKYASGPRALRKVQSMIQTLSRMKRQKTIRTSLMPVLQRLADTIASRPEPMATGLIEIVQDLMEKAKNKVERETAQYLLLRGFHQIELDRQVFAPLSCALLMKK